MEKAILDIFCYSDDDFTPRNYLRGYVFTDNALVLGTRGLELVKQHDGAALWQKCRFGRFLLEEMCDNSTIIRTDPLGQESLYYWQERERWIISNSLLLLADKLKRTGEVVQPYQPAIDTFKMTNQTLNGGQLLSGNTVVAGVKLLPLGCCFKVSHSKVLDSNTLTIEALPMPALADNYQQCMVDYCSAWLGRVAAIATLNKKVGLALSGGFDSRSCLAILQNTQNGAGLAFSAASHEYDEEEYLIAKAACERIGIQLSKGAKSGERKSVKLPAAVSFGNSMLAHAGVKTNFGIRDKVVQSKRWHCIGGSVIGTFTMRNSFLQRSQAIKEKYQEYGASLNNEIATALRELKIDLDDELAMFHHYYNFRARFHYGLDLYTSQHSAQLHPLLDYQLIQAAILAGKNYTRDNGINRDIILLMRPELLEVPFDGGRAVASDSLLTGICFADIRPVSYQVFGKFDDAYDYDLSLSPIAANSASKTDVLSKAFNAKITELKKLAMQFGFSDKYVAAAAKEITAGGKLKKAGVLLGLLEIFG